MTAANDNDPERPDDATQVLAPEEAPTLDGDGARAPTADDSWPVDDRYLIEPDAETADESPGGDKTVVAPSSPAPAEDSPWRRFAAPGPGLLAAIGVAALLIGIGAWLVSRDGTESTDDATAGLTTTAPNATTETSTTPAPAAKPDVPDVSGMSLDEARRTLEEAGFRVRVVRRESDKAPGDVLRQEPKAGTALAKDDVVVLTVARAAAVDENAQVSTPDVIGLTASNATEQLREAGLRVEIERVSSSDRAGTVLAQSPAAGTELDEGSIVSLKVAEAPPVERVDLPNLVGENVADARSRLRELGLRVRVTRVVSAQPAGTVIGQSPRAGARVQEGAAVTLRVSTGAAEATVPDVVGLDEAAARLELENAGFEVRVTDQSTDDPAQDGLVVEQTPSSGSTTREGAVVTLTVARFD